MKLRLADYDPTRPNERLSFAKLQPEVKTGDQLAMNLVAHGKVRLAAALQVGGPKPKNRFLESRLARPPWHHAECR